MLVSFVQIRSFGFDQRVFFLLALDTTTLLLPSQPILKPRLIKITDVETLNIELLSGPFIF
jgi:hypothetical protein